MGLLASAPDFAEDEARRVLAEYYGIEGRIRSLPSERDQNFRIDRSGTERYVLKIANATEDAALLDAQSRMLEHLAERVDLCPRLVPAASGERTIELSAKDGRSHFARLVTYLDGEPLANLDARPSSLLADLGRCLGRLDRALSDFDHPAFHRTFYWDLAQGLKVIRQYLGLVEDPEVRDLVGHLRANRSRGPRRRAARAWGHAAVTFGAATAVLHPGTALAKYDRDRLRGAGSARSPGCGRDGDAGLPRGEPPGTG
jgi:Ser/Thr protein kinase RdoA (MazF antagonist)